MSLRASSSSATASPTCWTQGECPAPAAVLKPCPAAPSTHASAGEACEGGRGSPLTRALCHGSLLTTCSAPFLELGQFAGYDMYDDWIPAAGVVTGIGSISG